MKNYLFILLLSLFATACSDSALEPIIEDETDEITVASVYANKVVETDDLFQLEQVNEGVIFSINDNIDLQYYSFQGEFLFNENRVDLEHIYSLVDGGMFIANKELGTTEEGFKKARFAFASGDLQDDKDLVIFYAKVNKESMICLVDIVYDEMTYDDICLQLTK